MRVWIASAVVVGLVASVAGSQEMTETETIVVGPVVTEYEGWKPDVTETVFGRALQGAGSNGQRVDPYRQDLASTSALTIGMCYHVKVPVGEIASRCGDDDGCTIRLSSDANLRSILPAQPLITDAAGLVFAIPSAPFSARGTSGDGMVDHTLTLATSMAIDCQLQDDGATAFWELSNCHNDVGSQGSSLTCTLRIDD